jgi:ribosomal-protein-alanine N-acetyltransferase
VSQEQRTPAAIRPVSVHDAAELREVLLRNWDFLRPWMPRRDAEWFSLANTRARIAQEEAEHRRGVGYHFTVVVAGAIVGRVELSNVVRGAWENGTIGYWIAQDAGRQGHATAAVRAATTFAFDIARLHRVQAAVMPRNTASLRVVAKLGLRHEGLAERYLRINDVWEDHDIFAVTSEEWQTQRC